MLWMMMQQQLEETDADQKRDITSLKERLVMGQDAYKEIFIDRENLQSELTKLKSRRILMLQPNADLCRAVAIFLFHLFGSRSFSVTTVLAWNMLPTYICRFTTFSTFKQYLEILLFTHHHHHHSDKINVAYVQKHCKTTLQYTRLKNTKR